MKAGAARLLLAGLGLALSLLAAEGLVRLAWPQPPAVPDQPLLRGQFTVPGDHPVRGEGFAAVVHVNAQGFVDQEWGPRQPGRPRVLVVGDSFVQAAQVPLEDGYGRALSRALQGPAGPVEVLSLGVPGAGTATALLLAERWLPELRPELLLYAWTTSNDVLNNHPELDPKADKPFFTLRGGALVRLAPQDAPVPAWARGPLWARSHLLRFVGRTWWARAAAQDSLARGQGIPAELRVHDPAGGPAWDQAWAVTGALVAALADAAEGSGARFGTVLFPDAVEATVAGRQAAVQAWPDLAGWDLSAAGDRAAHLAGQAGPTLDLRPALAAAERAGGPLYLPQDGHWTARGHAIAAQASAPFVAGLLAPPSPAPSPAPPSQIAPQAAP